jgi:hypothetical protein
VYRLTVLNKSNSRKQWRDPEVRDGRQQQRERDSEQELAGRERPT